MTEPFELHFEEIIPPESDLLIPASSFGFGDPWPGPAYGSIMCQRDDDRGTWSLWFVSIDADDSEEQQDRTDGITSAAAFCNAYINCGADFDCHPDLADVEEAIPYFERQDPQFAADLRAFFASDEESR